MQLCNLCRDMRDLPGDLGLTVIDDLPEMIGWDEGSEGVIFYEYLEETSKICTFFF